VAPGGQWHGRELRRSAGWLGRGCAERRWWAGWLAAARIRFKGFPIFYKSNDSNLNSNSNLNPLKEIQINPK
jgi:hypothetical protein